MVQIDFDEMMREFICDAEAFIAQPDFEKGIVLHDLAARVGVACNTRITGAERLVRMFHEFKRAIPAADVARLSDLLEEIRQSVDFRE